MYPLAWQDSTGRCHNNLGMYIKFPQQCRQCMSSYSKCFSKRCTPYCFLSLLCCWGEPSWDMFHTCYYIMCTFTCPFKWPEVCFAMFSHVLHLLFASGELGMWHLLSTQNTLKWHNRKPNTLMVMAYVAWPYVLWCTQYLLCTHVEVFPYVFW